MATGAAAGLDAQLARNKVQFVIDHDQIGRLQLVEAHGLADGLAGKIHEGLRLDQQHFFTVDHAVGDLGLKFFLPVGKAMAAEYFIRRHKTDIMPVMRIFGARIAKTCDKQHGIQTPVSGSDYSPSLASSSAPSALSSDFRPAGAAMVATVKSRS